MPLTEKQKKLIVAGGLTVVGGITAYAVAKALAKPREEVPPPEVPPPTYPPAIIELLNLPAVVEQYYGCVLSGISPLWQHLDEIKAYKNVECTQPGLASYKVTGRVLDAMSRGVPKIPVLVWASPTPDMYGGTLLLDGNVRTADNPLRVTTDENGTFVFTVTYTTDQNFLAEKGCRACTPIGCDVARPCTTIYPIYIMWFSCGYRTPGYIYQLTAKVEGTILSTSGIITAYANLVG